MSKVKELRLMQKLLLAVGTMMLTLAIGLTADTFSVVSYAQSQGKVSASSVKIRKEPSASSEAVGSATKDASVTINGQVTASDNTVWYQVFVNADTLGYIRSDLVTITDGSTPKTISQTSSNSTSSESTGSSTSTTTDTTPTVNTNVAPPQAEITKVNPISANVTGGDAVRVRGDATTSSAIVTTAKKDLAVTVIGQATGSDGKTWYQVNFIANGTEVTGFIRSDFLSISGEVTPYTEETETSEEGTEGENAEEVEETPAVTKDWDTQLDVDTWYLLDNVAGERYKIQDMFNVAENNQKLYEAENKKVKTQKILIIFLVFVILGLGGAVAYFIFRMRDMQDAAYFDQVEKETIRRRTAERPAQGRPTQGRPTQGRPAQGRPTQGRPTQGRPVQGRPAQGAPAQGRPAQGRPVQGAPAQGRPVQGRPAQGAPTQGRPAQGRPTQGAPVQGRPAQGTPAQQRPVQQTPENQNGGWKSKNFMADDDEFEFDFLNWDGDDDM